MINKKGSRAEVWHGNAIMTTGGLTKKDLFKNKHGRIVSLKKRKMSVNPEHNPLLKKGLLAKRRSKTFGPFKNKSNYNNKHKNYNNKKKKCSLSLTKPKNSISCFFSNLLN